jgi:tetraprenyl-beta-curcumene synthase
MGSELAANAATVVSSLIAYEREILPLVRGELDRWRLRALTIPDPLLRAGALSALQANSRNPEATAVFAILAPRARRVEALQAIAPLQIAIDYLDSIGEERVPDPLADGLALHSAICDAVSPDTKSGDYYVHHPQREDGGYLDALVAACQDAVAQLPASERMLPLLRRTANRCGEGQSYTHAAAAQAGAHELEAWANQHESAPGYFWWELAAGACSSVATHALIAAAADPRTTADEAALIDAAYFPPIGALTVLLDDLIDREDDLEAGEHNYLGYFADNEQAAIRISLLAGRAKAAIAHLRHPRRHRAILAGVAGFYLSAPGADSGYARPIRGRLLDSLDPTVRLIMVAMRLRRHG